MKKAFVAILFLAAVSALAIPGAVLAEPRNSVNLGAGFSNFLPHCKATIYFAEFEHMVGRRVSALARISQVHYTFDDGEHVEDGRPRGGDIGARYYFSSGMRGLFIGGSVGYWRSDWTFTHNRGTPFQFQGSAKSDAVRANVDIGARFPIGASSVTITPMINFGRYFWSTSCQYSVPASRVGTPCNEESEVTFYAFLAVTAGVRF